MASTAAHIHVQQTFRGNLSCNLMVILLLCCHTYLSIYRVRCYFQLQKAQQHFIYQKWKENGVAKASRLGLHVNMLILKNHENYTTAIGAGEIQYHFLRILRARFENLSLRVEVRKKNHILQNVLLLICNVFHRLLMNCFQNIIAFFSPTVCLFFLM